MIHFSPFVENEGVNLARGLFVLGMLLQTCGSLSGLDQILKEIQDTVTVNVHKQTDRIKFSSCNKWECTASCVTQVSCSTYVFLDPEDGDMFRGNVRWLSTGCTTICPRRQPFVTNAVRTFRYCVDSINTNKPVQKHQYISAQESKYKYEMRG
jgi:hypothetical protein